MLQTTYGGTTFLSQSDNGIEYLAIGFADYNDYLDLKYGGDSTRIYSSIYRTTYWYCWSVVITTTSDTSTARQAYLGADVLNMGSNTAGPSYAGTGDLFVGTGSLGHNNVLVDNIYLFTRALSSSDISDIFSSSNTFDRSGLIFQHRFHHQEAWTWDEGYAEDHAFYASTSVFADPSDGGHTLTVIGSFQLQVASLLRVYCTSNFKADDVACDASECCCMRTLHARF